MPGKRTDQSWNDWFFNDHPKCGKWHTDLSKTPATLDAISVTGKTAGFERLRTLEALRRLSVRDLSQKQLEIVAGLERLTELRIFGFRGADADALKNLVRLEYLTFEWAPKICSISWLTSLTRLRILLIADLKRVDDFAPLGAMTSLRYLSVSGSSTTPQSIRSIAPLAHLDKLEELDLYASVADDDVAPLATMSWLKRLAIPNRYPVRVYAELAARLPKTRCEMFAATRTYEIGTDRYVDLIGLPSRTFKADDPKSKGPIAKREAEFAKWVLHYRAMRIDT